MSRHSVMLEYGQYLVAVDLIRATGATIRPLTQHELKNEDSGTSAEWHRQMFFFLLQVDAPSNGYEGNALLRDAVRNLFERPEWTQGLSEAKRAGLLDDEAFNRTLQAFATLARYSDVLADAFEPRAFGGRRAPSSFDAACQLILKSLAEFGGRIRAPSGRYTTKAIDVVEHIIGSAEVPMELRRGGKLRDAIIEALSRSTPVNVSEKTRPE